MQLSDLEGIARSGAQARARGASYFDNPWLIGDLPFGVEWEAVVGAWWGGWMKADAGRDQRIAQLMCVPMW